LHSVYQNSTDSFEIESVSSTTSGEISVFTAMPLSLSWGTRVDIPSREATSSHHSAVGPLAGTYASAQLQSPQVPFHSAMPSYSSSSMSSLGLNSVQSGHGINSQSGASWEKSNNLTTFEPNFSEVFGTWPSSDAQLLAVGNPSLLISDHYQSYGSHSYSRHDPYHSHPQSLSQPYHFYQQHHQPAQHYHGTPAPFNAHQSSLQAPAENNVAPPRCNITQLNTTALLF
jgi:hypothetical protein